MSGPTSDDDDCIEIEPVDSMSGVLATEWATVSADRSFYQSHGWLTAVERDRAFTATYLLARRNGRLVGALPTYLWGGRGGQVAASYDPFRVFLSRFANSRAAWMPVLLLGARAGYANDVLLARDLDERTAHAVLTRLLATALELAEQVGARTVAMMYLNRESVLRWRPLLLDAKILLTAMSPYIDVDWRDFDAYLASLTRNGRHQARRDLRTFDRSRSVVRRVRLSECYAEAAPFVGALQRRHGHPDTDADMAELLGAQADACDDQSHALLSMRAGRPVGFALHYAHDGALYGRVCGFLDGRGSDSEYFALAYYEPLELAMTSGLTRFSLGLGALGAKLRRGATVEPLYSVVFRPTWLRSQDWASSLPRWNDVAVRAWARAIPRRLELDTERWRPSRLHAG